MDIKVFIGSTIEDLEQDCRKAAIGAVQKRECTPIIMENWVSDAVNAVDLCKDKIANESTHYLAIFAFSRGFTPEQIAPKSITEAEFDWAREFNKKRAVFLPERQSQFGLQLQKRAKNQGAEKKKAQQEFLKSVLNTVTCNLFGDLDSLKEKLIDKIWMWKMDGIRNFASEESQPDESKRISASKKANLFLLGREDQVKQFDNIWRQFPRKGLPRFICYLIHGPKGFGHAQMTDRLCQKIEADSGEEVKFLSFSAALSLRANTLEQLVRNLGNQLKKNSNLSSVVKLADLVNNSLTKYHIVLRISNPQRLDGSIRTLKERFWIPLLGKLNTQLRNQFIALLEYEEKLAQEEQALLCDPANRRSLSENLNTESIFLLPELTSFEEGEIEDWLFDQLNLKPKEVEPLRKQLFRVTNGRPSELYDELKQLVIE